MGTEDQLKDYSETRFRRLKLFPLLITTFTILLLAIPYYNYINDDVNNNEYTPPISSPISPPISPPLNYPIQDMKCPHYKTALFIFSEMEQVEKRMLMREELFGITDNIIPCMKQDTTEIFYKFFVKKQKKLSRNVTSLYTSERMEYYHDIVEIDIQHNDYWHQSLLEHAQSLQEKCTTFDHLILIDIFTMINLEKIKNKIASSKATMNTQKMVWGLFDDNRTENMAAIIGSSAIQPILHNLRFKLDDTSILSSLFKQPKRVHVDLTFINEPTNIIEWPNTIQSITCLECVVAIGNIYQDWEMRKIKKELNISTTTPCNARLDLNPYSIGSTSKFRPNIAVVTSSYLYYDNCMVKTAPLSAINKREYAERYGYAFVSRSTEFAQQIYRNRRAVWGKIDAVEKILPHYEWLLWLDMDAIFVNKSLSIEHLLEMCEKRAGGKKAFEKINIIVARPVGDKMINAGVFLMRNTDWTKDFLRRGVQSRYDLVTAGSLEQQAMRDAIKRPEWEPNVLYLDQDDHTINTFPDRYIRGDYIVHYAPINGCPSKGVLRGLSKVDLLEKSPDALISLPF